MPAKTKRAAQTPAAKPLKLTVTIPAAIAPLFRAMAELHIAEHESKTRSSRMVFGRSVELPGEHWNFNDVARHGIVRWLVSEESMDNLDQVVSKILKTL